ncbi:DoxX family protein [Streptomyces sp. NPDC058045]|uniref:DoxX family protein n=1 Tax=Streptomyces sp. NPDC058045 TaxID=3346311 RepID=UPI0036E0725C
MTCVDRRDLGLLLLRLGTGGALAAHGTQKLFGWFGGYGVEGTAQFMESLGYRPGKPSALASGLAEAGGGTLLALGLATPAAGSAAAAGMAGAAAIHAPHGFWGSEGGYELPAAFGLIATSLAVAGPGRLSLDAATGNCLNRPWMIPLALAAAGAAAASAICARQRNLHETQGAADQEPTTEAPGDE